MKPRSTRHTLYRVFAAGLLFCSLGAEAANLTICSRAGNDGSLFDDKFDHMRVKLTDATLFGSNGTVSTDSFTLQQIPSVDATELANCDIWFSGNTGPWTQPEKDALNAWMNDNNEHHFVVGGCDLPTANMSAVCDAAGVQVANHGVQTTNLITSFAGSFAGMDNPLTCGGAVQIETSGTVAANFIGLTNEVVLLEYANDNEPETITDTLTGFPKYLLTGDIDMWRDSLAANDGLVSAGSGLNSTNDLFVVNVFKFAADAVTGRIDANGGPLCAADYSNHDPQRSTEIPDRVDHVGANVSLDISGHFTDADNDTLTFAITGLPAGLSFNTSTGVISGVPTTAVVPGSSVTVTASDGQGGADASDTFIYTINTNPQRSSEIPDQTRTVGDVVTLDISSHFSDADNDTLTYTATGLPTGLTFNNSTGVISGSPSVAVVPGTNVTITASDSRGGTDATDTFVFTVNPGNAAPVVSQTLDDKSDPRNLAITSFSIASHFSDADNDTLTFTATNLPQGLSMSPAGLISGTPSVIHSPARVVSVTASDGNGGSVSANFTYDITNTPPVVSAPVGAQQVQRGTAVNLDVSSHFSDANGDSLSFIASNLPQGLSMSPQGVITGTPSTVETQTVTVTVSDGQGGQITHTFTYQISEPPAPPVINDATYSVNENAANGTAIATIPVTDPNTGDTHSFVMVSGNESGVFALSSGGALSVANGSLLDHESQAQYTLVVEVSDGSATDRATVTINVADVNEPPVPVNDTAQTAENVLIAAIDVLGNDTDPDGDILRVSAVTADRGTASINSSGSLRYKPPSDYVGPVTLTYTVADRASGGLSAQAQVQITVGNDNDQDGIADPFDVDDDNDGINDTIEGEGDRDLDGIRNSFDIDADNDGILDALEREGDMDGDGFMNFLDLDSDNDGIFDLVEAHADLSDLKRFDTNRDGVVDETFSYGPNGLADAMETAPESGVSRFSLANTDNDPHPDYLDRDSDADGIPDTVESDHSDVDGNGILDAANAQINNMLYFDGLALDAGVLAGAGKWPRDTDNDNAPDFRDLDSDNDGIVDLIEAGGSDVNGDGRVDSLLDENGDGFNDLLVASPLARPNTDADGLPDYLDLDSDNDGLSDLFETGGEDTNGDGLIDNFTDTDGDGLDDTYKTIGATLRNTDGKGLPDYRDLDSDGDGISDLIESGGVDVNGDGVVDALNDVDQDGIPDAVDVDQTNGNDADGDGIDDKADPDFNGDTDLDKDGISDKFDGDPDGNGFSNPRADVNGVSGGGQLPDANGNGIPDVLETDNDGIVRTGLDGQGCTLGGNPDGRFDPVLPGLLLLALLSLWRRRQPD